QKRALTRSRAAGQRVECALRHVERYIVEHGQRAVGRRHTLAHALQLERIHCVLSHMLNTGCGSSGGPSSCSVMPNVCSLAKLCSVRDKNERASTDEA